MYNLVEPDPNLSLNNEDESKDSKESKKAKRYKTKVDIFKEEMINKRVKVDQTCALKQISNPEKPIDMFFICKSYFDFVYVNKNYKSHDFDNLTDTFDDYMINYKKIKSIVDDKNDKYFQFVLSDSSLNPYSVEIIYYMLTSQGDKESFDLAKTLLQADSIINEGIKAFQELSIEDEKSAKNNFEKIHLEWVKSQEKKYTSFCHYTSERGKYFKMTDVTVSYPLAELIYGDMELIKESYLNHGLRCLFYPLNSYHTYLKDLIELFLLRNTEENSFTAREKSIKMLFYTADQISFNVMIETNLNYRQGNKDSEFWFEYNIIVPNNVVKNLKEIREKRKLESQMNLYEMRFINGSSLGSQKNGSKSTI